MSSKVVLWLVGRTLDAESSSWEFIGLWPARSDAVKMCSKQNDFLVPVTVGVRAPEEAMYFPEAVYPCVRGK